MSVRRCRTVQAFGGNECAGFAFDRNVFECLMDPTAFSDLPWVDGGFRRPPVAAIFRAARGGAHGVAEQLGLIAVVNVHLKAVQNNDYGPVRRHLARRLLRPSYCHTHACVHFCPSPLIRPRSSSSRALLRAPPPPPPPLPARRRPPQTQNELDRLDVEVIDWLEIELDNIERLLEGGAEPRARMARCVIVVGDFNIAYPRPPPTNGGVAGVAAGAAAAPAGAATDEEEAVLANPRSPLGGWQSLERCVRPRSFLRCYAQTCCLSVAQQSELVAQHISTRFVISLVQRLLRISSAPLTGGVSESSSATRRRQTSDSQSARCRKCSTTPPSGSGPRRRWRRLRGMLQLLQGRTARMTIATFGRSRACAQRRAPLTGPDHHHSLAHALELSLMSFYVAASGG